MVYRQEEDVGDGRKLEAGEQVREKSLVGRNGWGLFQMVIPSRRISDGSCSACAPSPRLSPGSDTGAALERRRVVFHTWDHQADGTAEGTTVGGKVWRAHNPSPKQEKKERSETEPAPWASLNSPRNHQGLWRKY